MVQAPPILHHVTAAKAVVICYGLQKLALPVVCGPIWAVAQPSHSTPQDLMQPISCTDCWIVPRFYLAARISARGRVLGAETWFLHGPNALPGTWDHCFRGNAWRWVVVDPGPSCAGRAPNSTAPSPIHASAAAVILERRFSGLIIESSLPWAATLASVNAPVRRTSPGPAERHGCTMRHAHEHICVC
jgi:hypothetical protein